MFGFRYNRLSLILRKSAAMQDRTDTLELDKTDIRSSPSLKCCVLSRRSVSITSTDHSIGHAKLLILSRRSESAKELRHAVSDHTFNVNQFGKSFTANAPGRPRVARTICGRRTVLLRASGTRHLNGFLMPSYITYLGGTYSVVSSKL